MRIFHVRGEQFTELAELPERLPDGGYLWIGSARREFEVATPTLQAALHRWTGTALVDLHVSDLLNNQLPSHFESTPWYDVLVFRRLAAGAGSASTIAQTGASGSSAGPPPAGPRPPGGSTGVPAGRGVDTLALDAIDTSPVGFALFDRVLLTVHPTDCAVREYFAARLIQQSQASDPRGGRLPPSTADLMLRMVNHMVDSYLDLRRLLTRQLTYLQQELFNPNSGLDVWKILLDSRNVLHQLEDTCEDQRAAIVEWLDSLDEWPQEAEAAARRDRELLKVRSRDVLEHIERVLSHVRRLESSAETAVQMHFSAQGDRTNQIMRTLTVLTAIFLPLNLVTGFFGMNFDGLPLVHTLAGFWIVVGTLVVIGVSLSWFFWRKRYLGNAH